MTATEALERRIDELCRENERLRGQLEYDRQTSRSRAELIDRLKAENAKLRGARDVWQENDAMLRELVRDMWAYITEPVGKRNNLKERLARFDDIADRMRELGVES